MPCGRLSVWFTGIKEKKFIHETLSSLVFAVRRNSRFRPKAGEKQWRSAFRSCGPGCEFPDYRNGKHFFGFARDDLRHAKQQTDCGAIYAGFDRGKDGSFWREPDDHLLHYGQKLPS